MVNYECYRCGYKSHIKTLLKRHFDRKNICQPKLRDINLDICKKYIFNGLSYEEYCNEKNSMKTDEICINPDDYKKSPDEIGMKQYENLDKNCINDKNECSDEEKCIFGKKNCISEKENCIFEKKIPDEIGMKKYENLMKKYTNYINDDIYDKKKKGEDRDNLVCNYCKKTFLKKEYLDKHLKHYCKGLINLNNIYEFNRDTFGRNIYKNSGNAGEIYVIKTDYLNNNYYKIGVTSNITKQLGKFRMTNIYEPRLYCYIPCQNIKEMDGEIKDTLKKLNIKKDIYSGDLDKIKNIIVSKIKEKYNEDCNIYEPELKISDLTQCSDCEECFYTITDLFNHFNICKEYRETLNKKQNGSYECKYCDSVFVRMSLLNRHEMTCKEKLRSDNANESMKELVNLLNDQLKYQNEELKKFKEKLDNKDKDHKKELEDYKKELDKRNRQIDKLIKKSGINHNNITNNIQNNIKLLSYRDTDLDIVTDKIIRGCINHSNLCIPYLVKQIHFNPLKPENHNIYISNLKNGYVMVYNGSNWDTLNRDEVIEDMINDKNCLIEEKVESWIQKGEKYPQIMNKFKRYLNKRDDNLVINKIKEDVKFMLYNNRNLIIETYEKHKLIEEKDI